MYGLQSGIIYSVLFTSITSGALYEFDNNFIDYDPDRNLALPYQYQGIAPVRHQYHNNQPTTVFPPPTDIVQAVEKPVGFISKAVSHTIYAIKCVIVYLLNHAPGLIAGVVVALGLCKFTSLCNSPITIYEAETELRSFATPERIARAADFVKEAVKKYTEIDADTYEATQKH